MRGIQRYLQAVDGAFAKGDDRVGAQQVATDLSPEQAVNPRSGAADAQFGVQRLQRQAGQGLQHVGIADAGAGLDGRLGQSCQVLQLATGLKAEAFRLNRGEYIAQLIARPLLGELRARLQGAQHGCPGGGVLGQGAGIAELEAEFGLQAGEGRLPAGAQDRADAIRIECQVTAGNRQAAVAEP